MATAKPKVHKGPGAQRTFAFDLQKPLFKGNLLKQGEFHRAFKERFFVLYPGFLVYYDAIRTWQYDLQRGETLGSRLNALKLKGGSVQKAKNPPRGAKYAFVIHLPDPSNKRRNVLLNAKSNEERFQWIAKITSAIPSTKVSPAKTSTSSLEAEKDSNIKEVKETVTEDKVKEEITSDHSAVVNGDLSNKETIVKEPVNDNHNGHNELTIASALGPRDTLKSNSSIGSDIDLASDPGQNENDSNDSTTLKETDSDSKSPKETEPSSKPEPDSRPEKDIDSNPENVAVNKVVSTNHTDNDTDEETVPIISSTNIEVNKDQKGLPQIDNTISPVNKSHDSLDDDNNGDSIKRDSTIRITDTNETVIPAKGSPKLSITIANGTSSSSSISDIEDDQPPSDEDSDGVVELPGSPKPIPQKNGVVPPQISVDEPEDKKNGKPASPSSPSQTDDAKQENLSSPTPDRRRPSGAQAFTDKRGFLYKQGGQYKTWHLRYFILQPGMFMYYKGEPKGKPLGEVKLSRRTKISLPKKHERTYSSYQFTIYSPSEWNKRSVYCIAANNEREMKDWIEAFKLASGMVMNGETDTNNN